jgi:hypothetical protein
MDLTAYFIGERILNKGEMDEHLKTLSNDASNDLKEVANALIAYRNAMTNTKVNCSKSAEASNALWRFILKEMTDRYGASFKNFWVLILMFANTYGKDKDVFSIYTVHNSTTGWTTTTSEVAAFSILFNLISTTCNPLIRKKRIKQVVVSRCIREPYVTQDHIQKLEDFYQGI